MAVRLFSAKGAGDDLAAGRMVAGDQSLYLSASCLLASVAAAFIVFLRIGRHTDRVSVLRGSSTR